MVSSRNPFQHLFHPVPNSKGSFVHLFSLNDPRMDSLPLTIRILLECAIRNCDEFLIEKADVEHILDWKQSQGKVEVPFKPARVLMQDFTGVPSVVDLAAMRDAVKQLNGDPARINPQVPVELVVDHSVQVDQSRTPNALSYNEQREFKRNHERFLFLKWGSHAFDKLRIVPPGKGIVHQMNMEVLARVGFYEEDLWYPDTLVGTDSHTTMVNGLGVLGWGVGGIEAEAAMLGQPITMLLPQVVGVEITGELGPGMTATDVVLSLTALLRQHGVVGKFVEFFGSGLSKLSVEDRATISNMAPEYGATCGFFPADEATMKYLSYTGRDPEHLLGLRAFLEASGLLVKEGCTRNITYSSTMCVDLGGIEPCIAGPKRPHDRVRLAEQKKDFVKCITNPESGFKGFGLSSSNQTSSISINFQGRLYTLTHGSIILAAITSCTNTSNPAVLMGAGLLARNALELGLSVNPYIKTSLSPGSQVVTAYLRSSNLLEPLAKLGFGLAGYGCMTCIGNSGPLYEGVSEAVAKAGLVAAGVLSGNRNFEGRIHASIAANYLASPMLVVAYALAGTMAIDLTREPLGISSKTDKPIYLSDIWPSAEEIATAIRTHVTASIFVSVYKGLTEGNEDWEHLPKPKGDELETYAWSEESTYIHKPPFFTNLTKTVKGSEKPKHLKARCLLLLGDSVTTDHISPAGNIAPSSPAASFLASRGVSSVSDLNTYGARRGNDEVMLRGTFANIRLNNRLVGPGQTGPFTHHLPSMDKLSVFDAAMRYKQEGIPLIIVAGREYGSGSSRDWAAKGTMLLGVRAVLAESYERIHRSNLVGMGVMPLQFYENQNAQELNIHGDEVFEFSIPTDLKPGQDLEITRVRLHEGAEERQSFKCKLRLDTEAELVYYHHGGILNYVIRNKIK